MPSYCVWEQKTEADRNRCDVVFAVKVLFVFHVASSVPWVAQVFHTTSKASLFLLGKRSCEWQIVSFPSWMSCHHPSFKQSPTAERLVKYCWGCLCLLGGCLWRSIRHGRRDDSKFLWCHSPTWQSLCHAPGTGPCHLIRLDMSGSVLSTTAERQPPLLKHQWLFVQKV